MGGAGIGAAGEAWKALYSDSDGASSGGEGEVALATSAANAAQPTKGVAASSSSSKGGATSSLHPATSTRQHFPTGIEAIIGSERSKRCVQEHGANIGVEKATKLPGEATASDARLRSPHHVVAGTSAACSSSPRSEPRPARGALGLLEPDSSDSDAPPQPQARGLRLPTTALPKLAVSEADIRVATPTGVPKLTVSESDIREAAAVGIHGIASVETAADRGLDLQADVAPLSRKRHRLLALDHDAIEAAELDCHEASEPSSKRLDSSGHAVRGPAALEAFIGPDDGLAPRWSDGSLVLPGGAVLPERIAACLRQYQRDGVVWLYEKLFVESRGCLLTDEMGLGKTVQVACCLVAGLYTQPHPEDRGGPRGPVLVVVPPTLQQNWIRELRRWGPFKVEVMPSAPDGRQRALQRVEAGLVDVLIASRGLFRVDDDGVVDPLFMQQIWGCVVIDEVHNARNPKGHLHRALTALRSPRKLGMTGTPLQNKLSDVWALLRAVGANGDWDLSAFEARFGKPIALGQKRKASVKELAVREDALKEFHDLMNVSCLRRTKDGVALMLPGKNDRIVPCPLSEIQRIAYRNLINSPDFQLALGKRQLCVCGAGRPCACGAGPVWRYIHQRQAEQKGLEDEWAAADDCMCRGKSPPKCLSLSLIVILQRLTNHIEQLKPDPEPPRDGAEQAQQNMMRELCDIAFAGIQHSLCTTRRMANRLQLGSPEACGKMQVLLPLLRHWRRNGQKALVFSRSTRLLDILEACLFQQGWSPQVLRLDGGTPSGQRQRLVDEFNSSSTRGIFLISTRAGGVGLNLTSASIVVIFDPDWNPFSDLQAQDRSFRIGQTRVVEVYRLLGAGTIEEQVYVRQVWKQQLASTAIDGTRSTRRLDGATFGLASLFELHETSMLTELMAGVFTEKARPKQSTEAGVTVFDDVRGQAADALQINDLYAESDHEGEDADGVDRKVEDDADSDAAHDRNEHSSNAAALEQLHGMFDQVDHSKLFRNDTQENLLLMDLDEDAV